MENNFKQRLHEKHDEISSGKLKELNILHFNDVYDIEERKPKKGLTPEE